ncbi:hypothetical protein PAMP_007226 [Pampus punctatissimus]
MKRAPQLSLWGKVADFTPGCSHWRLKTHFSIPALQELTVCLNLKFKAPTSSPWTVFMYRHPEVQYAELGLGVNGGRLVVWLFGVEWTTLPTNLDPTQWHSLCLTWSHMKDRPVLYVNGSSVVIMAAHTVNTSTSISPSCCKLAPNGTLTLGAAHSLVNGNIQIIPSTGMLGKLSLFRLWGRERTKQEVTSLNCTEGELVKWERNNWDTQVCAPLPDSSLQCEWSVYEVRLMFVIINGNNTEQYTARDIAHHWLRDVLPTNIYLYRVSVFEVTRFECLVYVNVIPSLDVSAVQNEMHSDLKKPYHKPSGLLQLQADTDSIHTTPVESFSSATTSPPDVTTEPFTITTTTFTSTTSPATFSSTTTFKTTSTTSNPTSAATATTFTQGPVNISVVYFEVKMNVSITGDCETEQILSTWLNMSLPDDMMIVLELYLIPKAYRESCVFQVQVMMSRSDTQEIEEQIRYLLLIPYSKGSISIATEDIQISRILILECNAETYQTRKGLFEWPATSGGKNATQPCPENPRRYATRHCTKWMTPDLEDCPLVVETIPDLDHVEVTAENALDVVEMIESLLRNQSTLNHQELVTVLNKLEDVVNLSVVTPNLGQALINLISDILESDSYLVPFTNTILNITEAVGDRLVGFEGSFTLAAPSIAISVVDVDPGQFGSLTFGVSSVRAGSKPEIFINRYPFNSTVAFISLPSVLQNSFPQNQSPPRVQFQFYGIPLLFKSSEQGQILNTFVVSASVTNASSPIKDLDEHIKVTLHHLIPNNDVSRTQVDPANEQILTIITYVGCGVSSLFLGITVLTYTAFEKLRRDYPSQILINLSLALLGLNLVFLVNSWLSSWGLYGLCVAVASTLHYFLLASFTWMGLEAVNMYLALVKVFNVYVPSYILKFCALGWGIPLVICVLVLLVNREAYGSHLYADAQPSLEPLDDNFCWLQDDMTFYVSVVAYAVLVFLFNTAIFVVVLIQIRHMRVNSPAGTRSGLMHDLKGVASLTLLLGLTWTIGFITWGPARVVLLYLFSGLNTLQGLFIFLFHCLMKENVRKQWRIHLCFGRFRLDEYSEWSNSASVGVVARLMSDPPRASVPSVHSVKSSSTDSTSASSDSSQRDSSSKRPNLGLFVNSLALARAQRRPSGAGALPSQRGMMNLTPGWRNHLISQQNQR